MVKEWPKGGNYLFMHYAKNGVEAWATMDTDDIERAHVQIVELAPNPVSLILAQPAAKPEVIDPAKGDFPYLTPIRGSKLGRSEAAPYPFYVTPKGASTPELVAPGSIDKAYRTPGSMSNSLFRITYHDALIKAGWTISE